MSCAEYQSDISEYLDAELHPSSEAQLFRHLGTCEACRVFMASCLRLRSALLSDTVHTPESFNARFDIEESRQTPGRIKPSPLWIFHARRDFFPLPAAASIALLLFIGSLILAPSFFPNSIEEPQNPMRLETSFPIKIVYVDGQLIFSLQP